jgi:DNA primase
MFNCFTCKKKGNLAEMVSELGSLSHRDLSHVSNRVMGDELPEQFAPWDAKPLRRVPVFSPMDLEDYTSTFLPVDRFSSARAYLASRNIGKRVSRLLDLRFDEVECRVVFKVTYDGELVGLTGRAINFTTKPKIKNYPGFSPHSFLLGEECMVHGSSTAYPIVLVEGQFDLARFHQNRGHEYADCLSIMGSTLHPLQLDRLLSFDRPIVFMLDNDEAGREGLNKAVRSLRGRVEHWLAEYPKGITQPDEMSSSVMRRAILR